MFIIVISICIGIVFAGDTNEAEGHFRWFDAVKAWNIPSGEYFIIDSY